MTLQSFQFPQQIERLVFWKELTKRNNVNVKKHVNLAWHCNPFNHLSMTVVGSLEHIISNYYCIWFCRTHQFHFPCENSLSLLITCCCRRLKVKRNIQICVTLQSFQSTQHECFLKGADQKESVTIKKHANMHDIAILSITSDWLVFFKQLTKRKMSKLRNMQICTTLQSFQSPQQIVFGFLEGADQME